MVLTQWRSVAGESGAAAGQRKPCHDQNGSYSVAGESGAALLPLGSKETETTATQAISSFSLVFSTKSERTDGTSFFSSSRLTIKGKLILTATN